MLRTNRRLLLHGSVFAGYVLWCGVSCLFADKLLPPVDVTESETARTDNSDSGRVSISAMDKRPSAVALPPVEDGAALNTSRALMNSLRRGAPIGRQKAATQWTATKKAVAPIRSSGPLGRTAETSAAGTFRVNRILQTAADDEASAGVISIPALDEQLPPIIEPPVIQPDVQSLTNDSPPLMAMPAPVEGCVSMKDLKKETRRAKRRSRVSRFGGRFFEFYDPDLERLDVDDYDHTILLISDTDEDEPAVSRPSELDTPEERAARKLFSRKITDIKPTLQYAWGKHEESLLPDDFYVKMDNGEYVSRVAPRTVLQWEPTNLWYHPLYFEDPGLERYGHTRHPWIQPLTSTGRFFGQVATLPYQMTLHPPKCKEFALGYYQPGEWAPRKKYRMPFNEEASAVQFLWITGLVLLIP